MLEIPALRCQEKNAKSKARKQPHLAPATKEGEGEGGSFPWQRQRLGGRAGKARSLSRDRQLFTSFSYAGAPLLSPFPFLCSGSPSRASSRLPCSQETFTSPLISGLCFTFNASGKGIASDSRPGVQRGDQGLSQKQLLLWLCPHLVCRHHPPTHTQPEKACMHQ